MTDLKRYHNKYIFIYIAFAIISFISAFIYGEDSLGGAYHDYKYHENYFFKFAYEFKKTILEYGNNYEVRNSPVFYILISLLVKFGFNIFYLKYLNALIIIPLLFYFAKSLKIKYENISLNSQIIFLSIILLSPTVRSLAIHPYPLLWAICFFVISIYFYLKFEKSKNEKGKLKNALYCVLNLSISSYLTPNFAIFIIFYGLKFFFEYKFSKKILIILFFSFFLSLPALFFLLWKDLYIFQNEVYEISSLEKFNLANKIVIISSIIFLFFLPFLKKIKTKLNLNYFFKSKKIVFISIVFITCVILFDFKMGAGGGLFYQLSNFLFKNNFLLFFIFLLSLMFFNIFNLYNFNNLFIFSVLILYNLQYTIYYKYFDPILLFIFLFLFKFDKRKIEGIDIVSKRYFLFYIIFLLINLFKNDIRLFLV